MTWKTLSSSLLRAKDEPDLPLGQPALPLERLLALVWYFPEILVFSQKERVNDLVVMMLSFLVLQHLSLTRVQAVFFLLQFAPANNSQIAGCFPIQFRPKEPCTLLLLAYFG